MTRFVVLAGFLWLPVTSLAQEASVTLTSSPLRVFLAKAVSKDGKVTLLLRAPVQVAEEIFEPIQLERSITFTKRVVLRTTIVEQALVVDGKLVSVSRKDGKKVDVEDLPKLLEKPSAVALFHGKVDPLYVQVLHDNVLIIQVPEAKSVVPAPVPKKTPVPR